MSAMQAKSNSLTLHLSILPLKGLSLPLFSYASMNSKKQISLDLGKYRCKMHRTNLIRKIESERVNSLPLKLEYEGTSGSSHIFTHQEQEDEGKRQRANVN